MAFTEKKYLDYAGLQRYDTLIKEVISNGDVKKVALNTAEVTVGTTNYAAGNALLIWVGSADVTSEAAATYKIPMGAAAMQTEIDALKAAIENEAGAQGTIGNLITSDKSDLVAAINEVKDQSDDTDALIGELPTQVPTATGGTTTPASTIVGYIDQKVGIAEEKAANAIAGLDTNSDVALVSETDGVVTITGSLAEVDGIVGTGSASNVTLAKVAKTGVAEDLGITAINSLKRNNVAVTDTQAALEVIAEKLENNAAAGVVTLESADNATGALKTYTLYQGVLGTDDAAAKAAKAIGTIDIPRDYLVKSAVVSTVETANTPYTGAAVGDKYIDFVINTKDSDTDASHLYVAINDLIHPIGAVANASEVQVAVDANNQISASVVDIAASKITYRAADSTANPAVTRESVAEALARIDATEAIPLTGDNSIASLFA